MLSFTIGAESISIFLDGVFHSIDESHINHGGLIAELSRPKDERRIDMIRTYVCIKKMIEVLTIGNLTISETEVLFEGTKIGNLMAERLLLMLGKGVNIEPYALFMNNVFANPAQYTRDELHQWMKKARLPITPDGCFLAFKKVKANYMDCHSGKCDNTPGNVLEMDRAKCNPNRHETCSTGFHFASPGYFTTFGGERTLVVKVNPRDVTSIPSDYSYTKGRTCRYEVIAEIPADKSYDPLWTQDIVDLSSPTTPDWVKFAPRSGTVIGADGDPSDEVIWVNEQAAAAVEAEATDAYEATVVAAYMQPGRINPALFDAAPAIVSVGAGDLSDQDIDTIAAIHDPDDANALRDRIKAARQEEIEADRTFTTADGREFSVAVIQQAMKDASIRGAARNLGIQDSTLRGWIKKIG